MLQIIVHELYFVIKKDQLENLKELPRIAYPSLLDATREHNGRDEYTIKSYFYVWNVVQRNIFHP